MALKSWGIADFEGAVTDTPVEKTVLEASGVTITTLSLIISNYHATDEAEVIVTRTDSADVMKFKWGLTLAAADSPFALDSVMVYEGGDKLKVESNNPDVSVDVSGEEK